MREIGGYFPYPEKMSAPNGFLEQFICEGDDIKYMMSGRCANYLALEDYKTKVSHPVAYVPLYTCETVIDPFKKAGYDLIFYDFDKAMHPIFDEAVLDKINLISICGYFGFSSYDKTFLEKCEERNICILEDCTHSIFSKDGVYPGCNYIVGSMRKWMGVPCGGYAIKKGGVFTPQTIPPHAQHLLMRREGLSMITALSKQPESIHLKQAAEAGKQLWDTELLLRRIYDLNESDEESIHIMRFIDTAQLIKQRRENYHYLLEHFPKSSALQIVFPYLDENTVPSHFTIYAENRLLFKQYLSDKGIHATSYWPVGPYIDLDGHNDCRYIYDYVLSLPCDQRYNVQDMEYICYTVSSYLSEY